MMRDELWRWARAWSHPPVPCKALSRDEEYIQPGDLPRKGADGNQRAANETTHQRLSPPSTTPIESKDNAISLFKPNKPNREDGMVSWPSMFRGEEHVWHRRHDEDEIDIAVDLLDLLVSSFS
jgi:hypothetical protein